MPTNTDLDHALQLRLSKHTVAQIDEVIETVPHLNDFNRCRFIRAAIRYALYSLAEDGYLQERSDAEHQEVEQ